MPSKNTSYTNFSDISFTSVYEIKLKCLHVENNINLIIGKWKKEIKM